MRNVTLGLIQLENKLWDKQGNLSDAVAKIHDLAEKGAQIICLPEMFNTGYNLGEFEDKLYDNAETTEGPTVTALCEAAKECGVYIAAGLALRTGQEESMTNSAVLINDEGKLAGVYSKNHLFGGEDNFFSRTGEFPVFDTKYGKIGIMICADNNHPESARILALNGAEMILMPAAWRIQEADIWPLLIRCHALENNVFIAACNTWSKMEDLYLFGHSMIADPRGRVLGELTEEKEGTLLLTIDLENVSYYRSTMPSLKDRHPETYKVLCEEYTDN